MSQKKVQHFDHSVCEERNLQHGVQLVLWLLNVSLRIAVEGDRSCCYWQFCSVEEQYWADPPEV